MDYQKYRNDFLIDLRNESAISGSDTADELVGLSIDIHADFDEV